jgi:hypothetical protein
MEEISCIAREKSTAGCAHRTFALSLMRAEHGHHAYATEGRPMAWAKAVGTPNR